MIAARFGDPSKPGAGNVGVKEGGSGEGRVVNAASAAVGAGDVAVENVDEIPHIGGEAEDEIPNIGGEAEVVNPGAVKNVAADSADSSAACCSGSIASYQSTYSCTSSWR